MDIQDIFKYTSPSFYIFKILGFLLAVLLFIWNATGLADWHYYFFKVSKATEKKKQSILYLNKHRKNKLFFVKQKAWDATVNKIKKDAKV